MENNKESIVNSLDDIALATPANIPPQSQEQQQLSKRNGGTSKPPRYCACLNDIQYPEKWEAITFDATVADFITAGNDANRVPLKFKARFLDSGEFIEIISWEYNLIPIIKDALGKNVVFHMRCDAGYFNKNNSSVRCSSLTPTQTVIQQTEPNPKDISGFDVKGKINVLVDKYVADPDYRKLLKVMLTPKFYKWPAATSVHHAFDGGLSLHSYTVAYISLQLCKIYADRIAINKDLLITGALLHDIGKLEEYDEFGNVTLNGVLMSHISYGVQMINTICAENGIDPYSPKIRKLNHIICSHHGLPEYGSTNLPATIEAQIVHMADLTDSQLEQVVEQMPTINPGTASKKIFTLDGARLIKFN